MNLPRLSTATLPELPRSVARPSYDRTALRTGIVHLGVGAFHRAHQAVYTEAVLAAGDTRWGIIGASLRSADTRDALGPQDCLYAVNQRGVTDELAIIGSVLGLLVAPEDPAALVSALAHPDVAIASLTVTEKAYCSESATGQLDEAHPDILHDLAYPNAPRSALGLLAAAIEQRRASGLAPFTVLCCDNLPSNGATLHRLLTRFATLRSSDLGAYVAGQIACPDTMVDRIVPSTTAADRARIDAALTLHDAWPVIAEPFTQWVIEDRFPAGRPDWAATFVSDVAPFEAMKLRLLNGSHSALAYLGYLAGYETVAEAIADRGLAAFVAGLMADTIPTLSLPPGTDVIGYTRDLILRFRNPALRHRCWQIAMDGTQKLPPRLLAPLRERLARGLPITRHALVVAAWMRYVTGIDERGGTIDIRDPMAATLATIMTQDGPTPPKLVPALLGLTSVFGDLADDPRLRQAVTAALDTLYSRGAAGAAALAA
jgi:fructuronate reductase